MRTLPALLSILTLASLPSLAQAQTDDGWFEDEDAAEEASPEEEVAETADEPAEGTEAQPEAEPSKKPAKKPSQKSEGPRRLVVELPPRKEREDRGAYRHDGFYLRLSLGGSAVGFDSTVEPRSFGERSEYSMRDSGVAFDLMIGGTPGSGVVLGGGVLVEAVSKPRYTSPSGETPDDETFAWGMVGPFVDWYPNPRQGFHLGGLLGGAHASTTRTREGWSGEDEPEPRLEASGFGGSIWVGYDAWIANEWSLGVMLRASSATLRTRTPVLEPEKEEELKLGSVALLFSGLFH